MFINKGTQVPVHCVEHTAVRGLFYFLSREDCFISHLALFITIIIPPRNRFLVRKQPSFLLFLPHRYLFPPYFPILAMDRWINR